MSFQVESPNDHNGGLILIGAKDPIPRIDTGAPRSSSEPRQGSAPQSINHRAGSGDLEPVPDPHPKHPVTCTNHIQQRSPGIQ